MESTKLSPFVLPIRLIQTVNSAVCLLLGGALNVLLVWLVLKRTPKEMRAFSKILLHTCFSDLAQLATLAMTQPIPFVVDGVYLVLENGLATLLPSPLHVWLYDLSVFLNFCGLAGICVQFLYRYLVLCRRKELGLSEYFGLLGAFSAVQLLVMLLFVWTGYPRGSQVFFHNARLLAMIGDTDTSEWPQRTVLQTDIKSAGWNLFTVLSVLNSAILYAIVVWCGVKMVAYVRTNFGADSKKRTAEVNRQLTRNMAIQASLPVLNNLIYFGLLAAAYVPEADWIILGTMLLGPLLCWIPVLNPLVTIATVAPYRRSLLRVGDSLPSAESSPQQAQKSQIFVIRRASLGTTRAKAGVQIQPTPVVNAFC